jgi:hypothetical protein
MKRPRICLSLVLFLFFFQASSQTSKVNVAKPGSWIETVTFDENATPKANQESSYYYLLLDEQENFLLQEEFVHYAYKILSNEGVQQMSDLSFDYDPAYEKLTLHQVSIVRKGKIINQIPKNIQLIQREQSMDRYLYDGSMTAIIHLNDVRIGDIVEYSFTKKGYNPIYEKNINRKIYFNYGFAFEKSFKRLVLNDSSRYRFKYANTNQKPLIKKTDNAFSYTWTAAQMPAVVTDNHEPDWYNPYAYVLIGTFKDWNEVVRWANVHYSISENEKKKLKEATTDEFNADSDEEYALQVIRFVQDEVRYLGFESGLNSHKPHAPLQVTEQRFGDCKDKSFLLASLLQIRGIDAHPMLVNTTYRDKIADQLPSANAFDHCVVQFKLNSDTIYVDPTINNQGGRLHNIYFPYYGKGLVIDDNTKGLTDLPQPVSSTVREVQTFMMDSVGGSATLEVTTSYTGSDADYERSYFSKNSLESIQKSFLDYYGNLYPDIKKLKDIVTTDDRDSNKYIVTENYVIPALWEKNETNNNVLLADFSQQSIQTYFEVSKSNQRTAPYRLTFPIDYFHEIHVKVPVEWTVTPDQQDIETDYYAYDYSVNYSNRQIDIVTHYKTKTSSVPVEHFEKFVNDHEKMMGNLNYRLSYDTTTIQAKSNPWPGIGVVILTSIAGALLMFWLYHNYNPQPYYPAAWGQPIGGWLVLVGLGLCVTPLHLIAGFVKEPNVINGEAWLSMWYLKEYTLFFFLLLENVYNILFLLFSALLLVLFFRRRSSLPLLVCIFYGANCLVTIFDNVLALQIDSSTNVDMSSILRSTIVAAIWIPYFRTSQRVKKTFVTSSDGDDLENNLVAEPVRAN